MNLKTCKTCNATKPRNKFPTRKSKTCTSCHATQGRYFELCASCSSNRDSNSFSLINNIKICNLCIQKKNEQEQKKIQEYNSFEGRMKRFYEKNGILEPRHLFPSKKDVTKIKCNLCKILFQKNLMSLEDDTLCVPCHKAKSTKSAKTRYDYTDEREWRTHGQKKKREEYERKIIETDTEGVYSSRPQLQIAKYLFENDHHVEVERKIAFGYKHGCASNYTGDLRAQKENANYNFMERKRSIDIFVNENLVIEFDGTFFHMDERFYKPDDYNKKLKKTAREIWAKDKERNEEIKSHGYDLLVVKEYDFVNNKEGVLKEILDRAEKAKKRKMQKIQEYKREKGLL